MKEGQHEVFLEKAGIEALEGAIAQLRRNGAKSVMILACQGESWRPQTLSPLLQSLGLPVFGGIFPSIIHGGRRLSRGTLLIGFPDHFDVAIVSHLSQGAGVETQLQVLAPMLERAGSLITLVDGLSSNLETFVERLYEAVGVRTTVVGGGAGYLDLVPRPCLLSGTGMIEDAALLVAMPCGIDRGIAHGWKKLEGPFLVTRSHGNVLEELNFSGAFQTYRKLVEAHSGRSFDHEDFFAISKTYPLGIESIDGEFLVRDPIKQTGDTLVCVGEVPQNATLYLLKGESPTLIASAGQAASDALATRQRRLRESAPVGYTALVFDCISRVLFLDEAFADEIRAIEHALPGAERMYGALSIGEIASSRGGVIELMNKSTLVSLF